MSRPSRIAIVKELGSRTPRCLAAHAVGKDEVELVIVERYPAALGAEVLAVVEEDAKALAGLEHPNLASLISTARLKGDVAVLSEWVDGESLATVLAASEKPPVEVLLRAFVDVLEGLRALHASAPNRTAGAFTPEDVFVGVDGVTRLTRFGLGRVGAKLLGTRRAEYAAPEHVESGSSTPGDVFTAGLVLRECFDATKLERAGLGAVIDKATATDPEARYASVGELVTAVTNAGTKIASRAAVSQYMARVFGERIAARLTRLEPKSDISLSMNPLPPTTPPPAVDAKLPEEKPEQKPEPKPEPKPEARPAEPAPAAAVKVVKPDVKPDKSDKLADKPSDPKPIDKANDSAPRLPSAVRKPAASSPDVSTLARKPVPLPKRVTTQEASGGRAQEVSTELGTKATAAATPTQASNGTGKHVEPKPKPQPKLPGILIKPSTEPLPEPKPKEPEPKAVDVPGSKKADIEPVSAREALDMDVDLVSVRPPPIAPKKKKSIPPPAAEKVRDAAPVDAHVRISDIPAPPPRGRGVLLFFIGVILLAGGFAAGRFTAPEATPAPAVTPEPTTTTTVTATVTASATHTPQVPTLTLTAATGTAFDRPAVTASSRVLATPPEPTRASPPTSSKVDASRYNPGGI